MNFRFLCLTTSMFINLVHVNDDIEKFCQVEKLFLTLELHRSFEFYLKTHKILTDFSERWNQFRMKTCLTFKFYFYKTKEDEKHKCEHNACDIDTLLIIEKWNLKYFKVSCNILIHPNLLEVNFIWLIFPKITFE